MVVDWLEQNIVAGKGIFSHYCAVDRFESQIQASHTSLDQAIEMVKPYKHDQTTTVAQVSIDGFEVVLKRYNPRSLLHKFKRALRQTRARRCWQMSYVFAESGLNVARPIFMFERRFFFLRGNAYFATKYLDGAELLQILPKMDREQQLEVVMALRDAMKVMRQNKISHGDMKASNLLWVDNQLFFIDLDGARYHRTFISWQRSNKRDRRRFLKNWREMPEIEALFAWMQ
ncbi:MAG: hypothetical protein KTR16_06110 [Acidiferrobacterales bacterium]|nr:hypothetical protein [Acidiferrobacterales bacterium]